ncbi:MAG: sortase [Roseiflexus sp.]|jgi:LPXTG-site transpeptidase (sortase) family protein|nr:sortase [Roseiflexus sp.]
MKHTIRESIINAQKLPKVGGILLNPFRWASRRAGAPTTFREKLYWTLGNLLMLIGTILLAYVGGIYAQADYNRYAARGDTDAPLLAPVAAPRASDAEPAPFVAPLPFIAPRLNTGEGQLVSNVPDIVRPSVASQISRIIIPSIGVDSKVVEVGWEVAEQNGQQVAVWQVAEYAVGHHRGSANPGEGSNIVLAGHVGGYGKVFKDLINVKEGDQIILFASGQQYLYVVREQVMVHEEGVSPEQQAMNALYIAPTSEEMVTLVTCWPDRGPDKFKHRIIVRATPYGAESDESLTNNEGWNVR